MGSVPREADVLVSYYKPNSINGQSLYRRVRNLICLLLFSRREVIIITKTKSVWGKNLTPRCTSQHTSLGQPPLRRSLEMVLKQIYGAASADPGMQRPAVCTAYLKPPYWTVPLQG